VTSQSNQVLTEGEEVSYIVNVLTGPLPHEDGAQSSHRKKQMANVHLVIIGENGRSVPVPLEHSKLHKMKFQENQAIIFSSSVLCKKY